MPKRILITPGEPAGVGIDVCLQIAQQSWPVELIAVADTELLIDRAKQIHLPIQLQEANLDSAPTAHQSGILKILPVHLQAKAEAGKLNPDNALYVMQTLEIAASLSQQKKVDALVTGPVHKGILNAAGISFSGHTEFFAKFCKVPHTVMLFVVDHLKVALATTHIPLAQVSKAITKDHLRLVLSVLHDELQKQFHLAEPRISICGINPHAGEEGYIGREEIDVVMPVLEELREKGYRLTGPLPADTIFTPHLLQNADVILSMYHDQALPLIKYIGFDRAVNVTLGLPFIRTSVDHGTALAIAGTGTADAGSMKAAIQLAISMIKPTR